MVAAGLLTPGYDATGRTVSRLAAPGMPYAGATDVAIGVAAIACIAVALVVEQPRGRAALLLAGAAFLGAAIVHLDPASAGATWMHRAASGAAVLGMTAAPFLLWRDYGRVLLLLGVAEVAMLVLGAMLLPTSFSAWGAWERTILVLGLSCLVVIAYRTRSIDDPASAIAASHSNAGTYIPVPSVNSVKK